MIEIPVLIAPVIALMIILIMIWAIVLVFTRNVNLAISVMLILAGIPGVIVVFIIYFLSIFFGFPFEQLQVFKII